MADTNLPEMLAGAWAFMIACIHAFIGSRTDVRPLFESNVPEPAKSTLFYCWHIVTIILFSLAMMFFYGAFEDGGSNLTLLATAASTALAVWGFAVAALRRRSLIKELPQGFLFLICALLGIWGLST